MAEHVNVIPGSNAPIALPGLEVVVDGNGVEHYETSTAPAEQWGGGAYTVATEPGPILREFRAGLLLTDALDLPSGVTAPASAELDEEPTELSVRQMIRHRVEEWGGRVVCVPLMGLDLSEVKVTLVTTLDGQKDAQRLLSGTYRREWLPKVEKKAKKA